MELKAHKPWNALRAALRGWQNRGCRDKCQAHKPGLRETNCELGGVNGEVRIMNYAPSVLEIVVLQFTIAVHGLCSLDERSIPQQLHDVWRAIDHNLLFVLHRGSGCRIHPEFQTDIPGIFGESFSFGEGGGGLILHVRHWSVLAAGLNLSEELDWIFRAPQNADPTTTDPTHPSRPSNRCKGCPGLLGGRFGFFSSEWGKGRRGPEQGAREVGLLLNIDGEGRAYTKRRIWWESHRGGGPKFFFWGGPKFPPRDSDNQDRNLQFWGAVSTGLFWISPVDFLLFSPGLLCNLVRKCPPMWRNCPISGSERKRRILSRLWLSWLFRSRDSCQALPRNVSGKLFWRTSQTPIPFHTLSRVFWNLCYARISRVRTSWSTTKATLSWWMSAQHLETWWSRVVQELGDHLHSNRIGLSGMRVGVHIPHLRFVCHSDTQTQSKNFGQAFQILENRHFGTDMPRWRPRKKLQSDKLQADLSFPSHIFWFCPIVGNDVMPCSQSLYGNLWVHLLFWYGGWGWSPGSANHG